MVTRAARAASVEPSWTLASEVIFHLCLFLLLGLCANQWIMLRRRVADQERTPRAQIEELQRSRHQVAAAEALACGRGGVTTVVTGP